jgi:cobalamin biosynthesis protein CobT
MKMNESAKIAQWGKERDDDDGDNGTNNSNQSSGSSDDETSESSGSEEISIDSGSDDSYAGMSASAMYETYFGKLFDFKMQYEVPKKNGKSRDKKRVNHPPESFVAPAAENLEPKVFLTSHSNDIVMNGQCPELTDAWILGPWQDDPKRAMSQSSAVIAESKISDEGNASGKLHRLVEPNDHGII